MADIRQQFDRDELEVWLKDQACEVSVAIACRVSMRVLPLIDIADLQDHLEDAETNLFLPCLRANYLAWVAGRFPDLDLSEIGVTVASNAKKAAAKAASQAVRATAARAAAAAQAASCAAKVAAISNTDTSIIKIAIKAVVAADATATRASAARSSAAAIAGAARLSYLNALKQDRAFIDDGNSARDLAGSPLWLNDIPEKPGIYWNKFSTDLRRLNSDWAVWTNWYEARLSGEGSSKQLHDRLSTIPESNWQMGPRTINAHMRAHVEEFGRGPVLQAELTELLPPAQSSAPHKFTGDHCQMSVVVPVEEPNDPAIANSVLTALRTKISHVETANVRKDCVACLESNVEMVRHILANDVDQIPEADLLVAVLVFDTLRSVLNEKDDIHGVAAELYRGLRSFASFYPTIIDIEMKAGELNAVGIDASRYVSLVTLVQFRAMELPMMQLNVPDALNRGITPVKALMTAASGASNVATTERLMLGVRRVAAVHALSMRNFIVKIGQLVGTDFHHSDLGDDARALSEFAHWFVSPASELAAMFNGFGPAIEYLEGRTSSLATIPERELRVNQKR